MGRGANTPEEFPATQIENFIGDLEPEGLNIAIMPLEAGKEARRNEVMVEEVLTEGGHEAGVHEAIEVDEVDKEIARHIHPHHQQQAIL